MDNSVNNAKIYCSKTAVDDFFEEKTELDIVIPDYSPAASKILSCNVTPSVISHKSDDDRVYVDVVCKADVVYTDDDNGIHSVSKTESFSKSVQKSAQLELCRIKSGVRPISVNCRLQNPRRVTVRTVIGTALKAVGNSMLDAVGESDGIEAVYDNVSVNMLCGFGDASSHISGSIPVNGAVNEIICSGGTVTVTDVNAVTSKAIIKGVADVYVVYTTGEGTDGFCFAEGSIPFSDVIDVDGMTDDSECQLTASLTDVRLEIAGESGVVAVEADAFITASAYNKTDISLMRDAYSLSQSVDVKKSDAAFESLCDRSRFSETVNGSFSSDFDSARITGITAEPVIKSISPADGMLSLDGDIMLTAYMCNDNEYKISEKSVPFSVSRPLPSCDGNLRCEASAWVAELSYTMPDDETVNITASISFELCCFDSSVHRLVSEILPADDGETKKCKGVILYYAEKGEPLWEIAKKYRSSVNIIKRDNNIEDDTVENDKMLLISFN